MTNKPAGPKIGNGKVDWEEECRKNLTDITSTQRRLGTVALEIQLGDKVALKHIQETIRELQTTIDELKEKMGILIPTRRHG